MTRYVLSAAIILLSISYSLSLADDVSFRAIGPFGGIVSSIAMDKEGNVFAGTEGGGGYKTSDEGSTWSSVSSGLTNPFVYSLTITKDGTLFAGTKGGVFKSSDSGKNWLMESGCASGMLIPFLTAAPDGTVYASVWGSGVCRKKGDNWELLNNELQNTFINEVAFTKDGTVLAATEGGIYSLEKGKSAWKFVGLIEYLLPSILVDNNNQIYAAAWSSNIMRSNDNGRDWRQLGRGINPYVRHMTMSFHGEIFAATEDGIFKFLPDLKEWKSIGLKGISIKNIKHMHNNTLWAGSYGRGVYISRDSGTTWLKKNNGIANLQIISAFTDNENTIYAGTSWGLFKKTQDGAWEEIETFSGKRVQAVAKDSEGNIYAGTTSGIWRYDPADKKWARVKGHAEYVNISVIAIDKNNVIFAGTHGDGLFASSNKGKSWNELKEGIANQMIVSLTFDSKGILYVGTSNGIFRSRDINKNTFEDLSSNLENRIIQSAAVDKDSNIYVGTDGSGIFVRRKGISWEDINEGLKNRRVSSLFINDTGDIYAGTYDGLFVTKKGSNEWKDISSGIINRIIQTIGSDKNGSLLIGTWGGGIYTSKTKSEKRKTKVH